MLRKTLLFAAVMVGSAASALAQPVVGPYVALGGGVALLQNQFETPLQLGAPAARSYTFDPGPAAAVSVGYGLAGGLRLEIEGDFANNHVHGVELDQPERAGGVERQYGGFGNVLYDLPLGLPVRPYLGFGLGWQAVDLAGVNSSAYGSGGAAGGSATHGGFAYQGIAGFAYPLPFLHGLSVTLDYRLIGVTTPSPFERTRVGSVTIPFETVSGGFGVPTTTTVTRRTFRVETSGRVDFDNIFDHEVLLGLRYAFGGSSAARPDATVPVATTPAPAPARSYLVFFDWDRAELTPRARQIVAAAADASRATTVTTITVEGFADTSHLGAASRGEHFNLGLSRRRADSVRAALVADGVPARAIGVRAFGATQLLVPTGPDTREPQNRRVLILLQ